MTRSNTQMRLDTLAALGRLGSEYRSPIVREVIHRAAKRVETGLLGAQPSASTEDSVFGIFYKLILPGLYNRRALPPTKEGLKRAAFRFKADQGGSESYG